MSRFGDYDNYDQDYDNASDLWYANLQRALGGKRGQQALRELRDALLALPEKRLIAGALCTVDAEKRWEGHHQWYHDDLADNVGRQGGEGVCAVGALAWYKKVKAGAEPLDAFSDLPTLLDADGDSDWRTAELGRSLGLTITLAHHLAYRNDSYEDMTPEQRYEAYIEWIDKQLADTPVAA